MKRFIMLCSIMFLCIISGGQAQATDVYPAQGGGLIGRADGGYLPVAVISCGTNLSCSFDRTAQTLTVNLRGWSGSVDYDFPALGTADGTKQVCALSFPASIPGVELGAFCEVSSNHAMDAGAVIPDGVILRGVAGTNQAFVKACAFMSDAGQINLADAGYFIYCFSKP